MYGPDSDAALECYRDTDALLLQIREQLDWDDTVWIIVSDHDQEPLDDRPPIDLRAEFARRGLDLFALPEGSATVICGAGARDARQWLTDVDGVEGTAPFHVTDPALECCLAWSSPGRAFGFEEMGTERGTHGGPRTRTQVAVVTGGHPLVTPLAAAVADATCDCRRLGADHRRPARPRPARSDRTRPAALTARPSRRPNMCRSGAS